MKCSVVHCCDLTQHAAQHRTAICSLPHEWDGKGKNKCMCWVEGSLTGHKRKIKYLLLLLKPCTKQLMHNTVVHLQSTNAQPVPKQWQPTDHLLPVLQFHMVPYGVEYPSGRFRWWFCALRPSHWQGNVRSWNILGSSQRCSPTKTLVCYQHCFAPKAKA